MDSEQGGPGPTSPELPKAGEAVSPAQPGIPGRVPDEVRKAALAQHVASAVATQGARVESQSDFQAVVLTGQKVNHTLHFIVGIFTCGIWWIVWLILGLTGGEKRHLVQVDEYGNVRIQHVK